MQKKKKQNNKKNSIFRVFSVTFFSVTLAGIAVLAGIFLYSIFGSYGNDLFDIHNLTSKSTSKIVYIDENTQKEVELESLRPEENKIWIDYAKIPKTIKNAFIAVEDERFYKHCGFDIIRTAKAFFNWIFRRDSSFGGSTITQQLVKNLTQNQEKTALRKIKEILQSIKLERELTKDQILELYLNTIYLSEGCYGIESASLKFFGKTASELDIAQCASIAGITQYPSRYDPLTNPQNNKEKQKLVLKKMRQLGYLSEEDYAKFIDKKLEFSKNSKFNSKNVTSYFVDKIIEDVINSLKNLGYSDAIANKMLYDGGLLIYSTYNPKVQNAIDKTYSDPSNFPNISDNKNSPQSAIVVIDINTGAVLGISGGIGKKTASRTLNRATQTLRQPGSIIKPLSAFAPAFEKKIINGASILEDEKITIGDWTCNNITKKYSGKVGIRHALNYSLNTIPVKLIQKLRPEVSFRFLANNCGFTSLIEKNIINGKVFSDVGYPQLALGGLTKGVTVLEMAAAYATFPNGGFYTRPYFFTKVLDDKGKEIITNLKEVKVAMKDTTAYIMCQMLNGVVTDGIAKSSQVFNGIFTAGKTGTTSDNMDRWFAGFTPYYVGVSWYGYDDPKSLPNGQNPCIIPWKKIMDEIHRNLPLKQISRPDEIVEASYCRISGKLSKKACGNNTSSFYFTKDNMPIGYCDVHSEPKKIKIPFFPPFGTKTEDENEEPEGNSSQNEQETSEDTTNIN